MRIIISGGGTGGHIYPAIAIAQSLKEQNPNHEIRFMPAELDLITDMIISAGKVMVFHYEDNNERGISIFYSLFLRSSVFHKMII